MADGKAIAPVLEALPFAIEQVLSVEQAARIVEICEQANDRYLLQFVEAHGFCPYARPGRETGSTLRRVHLARDRSLSAVFETFAEAADDPKIEVVQLIFPLVSVSPQQFHSFVGALTDACNERQQTGPVFASAALHPDLRFRTESASGLIPLFRRAPDPTVQWVRLSALDAIYEGRRGGTHFVDLENVAAFFAAQPGRDLYAEIAEANRKRAEEVGVDQLAGVLRSFNVEAQEAYRAVLSLG